MKLACRKDGYPSWKGVQARSGGSAQKICGYPLYHFPIQIWILNHPNHPIESSHYDHILIILHTVKALPKTYQSPLNLIRVENLSKKNESALWPGVLSWTDTNAREAVKNNFHNCKNLWESEWKMRRQNSTWWIEVVQTMWHGGRQHWRLTIWK